MKNSRAFADFALDALLFIGFLVSFYLDLTGVELHQLLGIFLAAGACFHILRHGKWIIAVGNRLQNKLPTRTLVFAGLDAALTVCFLSILSTGVLISTWFQLPLPDYVFWSALHARLSVATLIVLTGKIILHGRWVLHALSIPFQQSATSPAKPTHAYAISRAQFLGFAGLLGAAAGLTAMQTFHGSILTEEEDSDPSTSIAQETIAKSVPVSLARGASTVASESLSSAAAASQDNPTTSSSTSTQAIATEQCTVLCNRHCAYPGGCRRYADNNINGWCDNGECY